MNADFQAFFQTGFLVLARVASIFLIAPIYSHKQVPLALRVGFSVVVTCVVLPTVPTLPRPLEIGPCLLSLFLQMALGLLQGLAFAAVLAAAMAAGDLVDLVSGYGMASVLDPADNTSHAVFSRLFEVLGWMLFLAVNGHLWMMEALIRSFHLLPPGAPAMPLGLVAACMDLVTGILGSALRLAAPIVGLVALLEVLGMVLSRGVPQLHWMTVSFPIKVVLALTAAWYFLPSMLQTLAEMLGGVRILLQGGI